MPAESEEIRKLLRQQAATAQFGSYALLETDLLSLFQKAAKACAAGLDVPFCKILRYRPEQDDLIVEAGCGWNKAVVGVETVQASQDSPQSRAFRTRRAVISNDLRLDRMHNLPASYTEHGMTSSINVVIKGQSHPYGILEVSNIDEHDYDQYDVDFLMGFANVLAEAVGTSNRVQALQATVEKMRALVEEMRLLVNEKDRILEQKSVLAEELHHRVRNNLQLIYGMLNKQLDDTRLDDYAGRRSIRAISRRVFTLSQVYDSLLGAGMTRTMDFGAYITSWCINLIDFQAIVNDAVTITCNSDAVDLDLDVVTALGIVVTEVVANSYEHAFTQAGGVIAISLVRGRNGDGNATMSIADDGKGFAPVRESKRHGVGLIRRLVEQVGGTAMVDSTSGTVWTITFPVNMI